MFYSPLLLDKGKKLGAGNFGAVFEGKLRLGNAVYVNFILSKLWSLYLEQSIYPLQYFTYRDFEVFLFVDFKSQSRHPETGAPTRHICFLKRQKVCSRSESIMKILWTCKVSHMEKKMEEDAFQRYEAKRACQF